MPIKMINDVPATKRTTHVYLTDDELAALKRAVERDDLETSESEIGLGQSNGGAYAITITLRTDRPTITEPQKLQDRLRSAITNEIERLGMTRSHCGVDFTPGDLTGLPRTPGYDSYCFQLRIEGDWAFDEREKTAEIS